VAIYVTATTGKSTLADRLLEISGNITKTAGQSQVLDSLQVEKERGITVKAQSASLLYGHEGNTYLLNLIDTPGHTDFSHEVSRSLSACDGVILLVDANEGVQAQTVANYFLAASRKLVVIPVLNKIDPKNANPERVIGELISIFDIKPEDVLKISAKMGTGVETVLAKIVERIPAPTVDRSGKFRGLLFDSWYDKYRGALNLVYVKDGEVKVGQEICSHHTKKPYEVRTLSVMRPHEHKVQKLVAGQVGLIGCAMRSSKESLLGDTFHLKGQSVEPLPGFKLSQPMVFAGIYPNDQSQHVALKTAIDKLILNDSAVTCTPDSSPALGQGWRLGFLGLLHLEVFSQRLQQEHQAEPILTAPSVTYKIKLKPTKATVKQGSDIQFISNPMHLPDPIHVEEYFEPFVNGTIITPAEFVGQIIGLCVERRGIQQKACNLDENRVMLTYKLPLNEIVVDFHDSLKALSSGFASFDYEEAGFWPTHIVKLNVLLNGMPIEELSTIVHSSKATKYARELVLRLKDLIPRQMVQIAVQVTVGGKILAREVGAMTVILIRNFTY
jgi:translation factor GUF1, mitochondrial